MIPMLRLDGLFPLMLNGAPGGVPSHEIVWTPGVASMSGPNPDAELRVDANTTLDIRRVGPWGVDRPLWTKWAYAWGIADSTGQNASAVVMSPSALGGGVLLPDGYDRLRYLPFAAYIKGSSTGMRLQIVTGWPFPAVTRYQALDASYDIVVNPTPGGTWATLDLSDWVPTDARVAGLMVQATGPSGYVRLRTPNYGDGLPFITAPSPPVHMDLLMSSGEDVQIMVSAGAQALVRVERYEVLSVY